jgi:hypothetical protein
MTRAELLSAALVLLDGRGSLTTTDLLDGAGVAKGAQRRRAWRDLNTLQATGKLDARRIMVPGKSEHSAPVPALLWSRRPS